MHNLRLATLVAMAAAGAASIAGATGQLPYRPQARRRDPWPPVEQSTRQELRGQRRAQGGPGITLNPRTFEYEPRA